MNITVEGKPIEITDKNARAYYAQIGRPIDIIAIKSYVSATLMCDDNILDSTISNMSCEELETLVNDYIEEDVRSCSGDDFYEEA